MFLLKSAAFYQCLRFAFDEWSKLAENNHDHIPSVQHENKLKFHTYIFFAYSICFTVNGRPEQAKHPTTTHLLPTYTKLIMSDSSVLICCANFIGELHKAWRNLAMAVCVNSMQLNSDTVTPSKSCCVACAQKCRRPSAHHNPTDHWMEEYDTSVHLGCFNSS